jgi:hypothetical protein
MYVTVLFSMTIGENSNNSAEQQRGGVYAPPFVFLKIEELCFELSHGLTIAPRRPYRAVLRATPRIARSDYFAAAASL